MKETLKIINKLKQEGIIADYAIGGAVAALNYIEPFLTHDLDLFITLENCQDGIVDLSPIYRRLKDLGYDKFDKEGLVIEEWPVQFIIPPDKLEKEALENAEERTLYNVRGKWLTAEYLMAICVKTGRLKDKLRIQQFVEFGKYDNGKLDDILKRHNLAEKWEKAREFLEKDNV